MEVVVPIKLDTERLTFFIHLKNNNNFDQVLESLR